MNRPARLIALTILLWLPATWAHAVGTPAGTELGSQAVMTYTQGSAAFTTTSNLAAVTVNEVLDFVVEWQDAACVPVFSGDSGEALTFRLQNTGNGSHTFRLTGLSALAGDDFDPDLADIHLDSDGDGRFDATRDERYVQGVNDPELTADQQLVVFLVCNVPEQQGESSLGGCKLAVGSVDGYGAPGTIIYGGGDDGTDAVIGPAGGFSDVTGYYEVVAVTVNLAKTADVLDPDGGDEPVAGAVITYRITLSVAGSGTARELVVTDPVPAHTEYIHGTLTLNGSPLSDTADADCGDVGASLSGAISVALGDIDAGAADQAVAFQVRIQ